MGSLLQIRGVPEETRAALKARAAERGTSLNGYLLELLGREASHPTNGEVFARIRARNESSAVSSVDALREARSARDPG